MKPFIDVPVIAVSVTPSVQGNKGRTKCRKPCELWGFITGVLENPEFSFVTWVIVIQTGPCNSSNIAIFQRCFAFTEESSPPPFSSQFGVLSAVNSVHSSANSHGHQHGGNGMDDVDMQMEGTNQLHRQGGC